MKQKTFITLLVFYGLIAVVSQAKKLPVALYYEALCPDSVKFVRTQLQPAYKDVGKYLDLQLVPFGFATANNSSGHWKFTCQHGPVECFDNKVHSCVIAANSIASSLEFVNCAMSSPQNEPLKECADKIGIPWGSIEKCMSSGLADELLVENGRKTNSVTPPISYIPTIIFNGVYNKEIQIEAEEHFLKVVCQLLKTKPDVCKYLNLIYNYIM